MNGSVDPRPSVSLEVLRSQASEAARVLEEAGLGPSDPWLRLLRKAARLKGPMPQSLAAEVEALSLRVSPPQYSDPVLRAALASLLSAAVEVSREVSLGGEDSTEGLVEGSNSRPCREIGGS